MTALVAVLMLFAALAVTRGWAGYLLLALALALLLGSYWLRGSVRGEM